MAAEKISMLESFIFIEHPILDMYSTETRLPCFITHKPSYGPCSAAGSPSQCEEIPWFYGNLRFNTVFKTLCHWFISWARWNKSTLSYSVYLISSSISIHQHFGLLSDIFLQGRETAAIKIRYNERWIHQYPKSVQKWRVEHIYLANSHKYEVAIRYTTCKLQSCYL